MDDKQLPIQPTDEQVDKWRKEDFWMDVEDMTTLGLVVALIVVVALWLVGMVGWTL